MKTDCATWYFPTNIPNIFTTISRVFHSRYLLVISLFFLSLQSFLLGNSPETGVIWEKMFVLRVCVIVKVVLLLLMLVGHFPLHECNFCPNDYHQHSSSFYSTRFFMFFMKFLPFYFHYFRCFCLQVFLSKKRKILLKLAANKQFSFLAMFLLNSWRIMLIVIKICSINSFSFSGF